jgi:hypothetical protein
MPTTVPNSPTNGADEPTVPSAYPIWPGADWMERDGGIACGNAIHRRNLDGHFPSLDFLRHLPTGPEADMHRRPLPVEVARHISIIERYRGGGIDFDATIEAAETMNPIHQALAAGHVVADFDGNDRLFAGLHQIGDVVFISPAIAGELSQIDAIHIGPPLGVDPADLEPNLLARKSRRDIHFLLIPSRAHVRTDHRSNALLGRHRAGIARPSDALGLPTAGNDDGPLFRQRCLGKLPLLLFADIFRIGGEIPCTIQTDRRPHGRTNRWIDYCRRGFPLGRKTNASKAHYSNADEDDHFSHDE